ncbi:MAG: NAD(P)-binding domain-containing protein, partial [Acidobacteriota bacterium]|nr:NAD(P)-binding domain-containing protein [Acidobacteriota bacterium]
MKTCVIGGGAWGSAFALYLGRMGYPTRLWIREPEIVQTARRDRENPFFLPGYKFPAGVTIHDDEREALTDADCIFIAVPSQHCRRIYGRLAGSLRPGQAVVSLTKGIEKSTLKRMTEIMT